MLNKMKNALFIGLDFLIDKNENIIFMEANSFPGLLSDLEFHYGVCRPLEKLVGVIRKNYSKKIVLVYSKTMLENWREPEFVFEKIKKLTNGNCELCILEKHEIENFNGELTNINDKQIREGIIFTPLIKIKTKLENNKNYKIINSSYISKLTKDKLKTYKILKSINGIKIPKTFCFKTKKDFLSLIDNHHMKKFVIKPRFGQRGKNVYVIDNPIMLKKMTLKDEDWLLQEKIEIKKINGNFWDIRVFVVNGKYTTSIKRISDKPIVNVSLGGKTEKLERKIQKRISNISEQCVKKIEKQMMI